MIATRNMKLYLPFERNANDFSGNGNNGTVSGAALVDGGKFGKCYSFDGVDDYIKLDSVLPCGVGTTISIWLNFDDLGSGVSYFLGGGNNGLRYNTVNQTLLYYCYLAQGTNDSTTVSYIPSAGFHHVVAVRTAARNVNWYIDGSYLGNSDPGNSADMNIDNIGQRGESLGYYYKGKIDSLAYYDKALSAEDIKRLYLNLHPLNG